MEHPLLAPRAELPTFLSSSAQQGLGMAEVMYELGGGKALLLGCSQPPCKARCNRATALHRELGRALSPRHPASRGSFLSWRVPALEGFAVEPAPSSVPAERLFRAGEALEELLGII